MEAKEELLESLKKLKEKVSELAEKREKKNNICWWNMEECPFYLEMKGFENAGPRCCDCSRLDQERFFSIAEDIFGPILEDEIEEAREEGKKEGKKENEEEICEEISEEIEGILKGLN